MNRVALLLLVGFLLSPIRSNLLGQTVVVRISEHESGNPIQGAFVTLFDGEGITLQNALTDANGRHLFTLPELGLYSIRAQMIGRETQESGVLQVGSEERFSQDLSLPVQAIELRGISVEGSPRCVVRPGKGERTAALWEEARKALEVAAWTQAEETLWYELVQHVRDLRPNGEHVTEETREDVEGFFRKPFISRPAEELARNGFVVEAEDGTFAFAPDAEVLLSDPFVDTHCFQLEESDDTSSVGLAFKPVEHRDLVDIEGVLWLDRATGELGSVEYRYTDYPGGFRSPHLGGRLEFERLPSGEWIVSKWHIRLPIPELEMDPMRHVRPLGFRLAGIREVGGEVTRIRDERGNVVFASQETLLLTGKLVDSQTGESLPGAIVRLPGLKLTLVADGDGEFLLKGIPPGNHGILVSKPGYDLLDGNLEVKISGPFVLRLTPKETSIVTSTGKVVGRVVVYGTEEPLSGAEVTVRGRSLPRLTDSRGNFEIQGLPIGVSELEVRHLGFETRKQDIFLGEGQTLEVFVEMAIEPIPLEGFTVKVRSRWLEAGGFYERQNRGFSGRQWTGEEIRRAAPIFVRELIENVPGVAVRREGFETSILGRQNCKLSVFVDDFHMPDFDIDSLEPQHIQAMELYQGISGIPIKYQMVTRCGVVLIWLQY